MNWRLHRHQKALRCIGAQQATRMKDEAQHKRSAVSADFVFSHIFLFHKPLPE
jgi:hypothetical protein